MAEDPDAQRRRNPEGEGQERDQAQEQPNNPDIEAVAQAQGRTLSAEERLNVLAEGPTLAQDNALVARFTEMSQGDLNLAAAQVAPEQLSQIDDYLRDRDEAEPLDETIRDTMQRLLLPREAAADAPPTAQGPEAADNNNVQVFLQQNETIVDQYHDADDLLAAHMIHNGQANQQYHTRYEQIQARWDAAIQNRDVAALQTEQQAMAALLAEARGETVARAEQAGTAQPAAAVGGNPEVANNLPQPDEVQQQRLLRDQQRYRRISAIPQDRITAMDQSAPLTSRRFQRITEQLQEARRPLDDRDVRFLDAITPRLETGEQINDLPPRGQRQERTPEQEEAYQRRRRLTPAFNSLGQHQIDLLTPQQQERFRAIRDANEISEEEVTEAQQLFQAARRAQREEVRQLARPAAAAQAEEPVVAGAGQQGEAEAPDGAQPTGAQEEAQPAAAVEPDATEAPAGAPAAGRHRQRQARAPRQVRGRRRAAGGQAEPAAAEPDEAPARTLQPNVENSRNERRNINQRYNDSSESADRQAGALRRASRDMDNAIAAAGTPEERRRLRSLKNEVEDAMSGITRAQTGLHEAREAFRRANAGTRAQEDAIGDFDDAERRLNRLLTDSQPVLDQAVDTMETNQAPERNQHQAERENPNIDDLEPRVIALKAQLADAITELNRIDVSAHPDLGRRVGNANTRLTEMQTKLENAYTSAQKTVQEIPRATDDMQRDDLTRRLATERLILSNTIGAGENLREFAKVQALVEEAEGNIRQPLPQMNNTEKLEFDKIKKNLADGKPIPEKSLGKILENPNLRKLVIERMKERNELMALARAQNMLDPNKSMEEQFQNWLKWGKRAGVAALIVGLLVGFGPLAVSGVLHMGLAGATSVPKVKPGGKHSFLGI